MANKYPDVTGCANIRAADAVLQGITKNGADVKEVVKNIR